METRLCPLDKCEFLPKEVCYSGHILSKEGISSDPRKLEALKNFSRPKNIKNIRQSIFLLLLQSLELLSENILVRTGYS